MKHSKIPQTEALAWLQANYPALRACAEIDRDWVWLAVDLRGDSNKPIREAIKQYGFIFHRKGGHLLASGKLGMWGHSCERPVRFVGGRAKNQPQAGQLSDPSALSDEEILAMFS